MTVDAQSQGGGAEFVPTYNADKLMEVFWRHYRAAGEACILPELAFQAVRGLHDHAKSLESELSRLHGRPFSERVYTAMVCNIDQQKEEIARLQREVEGAKKNIRGLLLSADSSWEENDGGHDWPEACTQAREFLSARPPSPTEECEHNWEEIPPTDRISGLFICRKCWRYGDPKRGPMSDVIPENLRINPAEGVKE